MGLLSVAGITEGDDNALRIEQSVCEALIKGLFPDVVSLKQDAVGRQIACSVGLFNTAIRIVIGVGKSVVEGFLNSAGMGRGLVLEETKQEVDVSSHARTMKH